MTDRDADLALLNKIGKRRPVHKGVFIFHLVVTVLLWIMATIGSAFGQSLVIITATGWTVISLLLALNYYAVGPLVRETLRLRAEIEALRSQERVAEPDAAPDRGGITAPPGSTPPPPPRQVS